MPSYQKKVNAPGQNADSLFNKCEEHIRSFLDKSPIGDYELTSDSSRRELKAEAKLFSAHLVCEDESLTLNVKLSLLAAPFKGQLDGAIDRWVQKYIV